MKQIPIFAALATGLALSAAVVQAQVPPDIAAQLREIGPKIDIKVAQIYAPLQPKPPYAGMTFVRDVTYGPDPLQKLDVFTPDGAGGKRPVLIFVHGGGFVRGDKAPAGSPFNDNVMVWAAKHGMVGVDINYRLAPKDPWPAGVQDTADAVAWVRAHIAEHGGDPNRIFLWGHSAGSNHVADYVAHDEFHPKGTGLAGAILMSGVYVPQPGSYYGPDPALAAQRNARAGLLKTKLPLMMINAELDPDLMLKSGAEMKDELCKAGRCPTYLLAKDHDHLSEGYVIGTADDSVSGPILAFIKSVK